MLNDLCCPKCGAELKVDGNSSIITCAYCGCSFVNEQPDTSNTIAVAPVQPRTEEDIKKGITLGVVLAFVFGLLALFFLFLFMQPEGRDIGGLGDLFFFFMSVGMVILFLALAWRNSRELAKRKNAGG